MRKIAVALFTVVIIGATTLVFHATQSFYKAFAQGKRYFSESKYEEALPYFVSAFNIRPADERNGYFLLWTYERLDRKEKAAELLELIFKNNPNDPEIAGRLGDSYYGLQDYARAEEFYRKALLIDKRPEVKKKLAEVLAWQKKYGEAAAFYRDLLAAYGADAALKTRLADILFWSKDYEEAARLYGELGISPVSDKERYLNLGYCYMGAKRYEDAAAVFQKLIEAYPQDLRINTDLANAFMALGDFKRAEGVFRDILTKDPDNGSAMLWLARILSWAKKYDESLELYDSMIEKYPGSITARREKARVLGWMRRYRRSAEEYRKILTDIKEDLASRLEMAAKDDFFRRFDAKAISDYNEWLELEPDNSEALYDLAQVYSRQMQWDNARNTYDKILQGYPSHFRAKQASDKVDMYSKSPSIDGGFGFYEADSASRDINVKYFNIYSRLKAPVTKHIYAAITESLYNYSFSDLSSVNRESSSLKIEYNKRPYFWAGAGYDYDHYSDRIKSSHNFNSEINVKPLDLLRLTFSQQRTDVIDNSQTLKRDLRRDDYKIRGVIEPNRRLSFGADYMYSYYSDKNKKPTYGADIKSQLLYEPRSLTAMYRYEEYKYDKPSDYYFSPGSFHYNTVGLEWRHFLNKEELFWGANNTYYTLGYAVNFDVHSQHGHTIYADIYRDWNDRLSTYVEWSKKMYEHKGTYREDRVMGCAKLYF